MLEKNLSKIETRGWIRMVSRQEKEKDNEIYEPRLYKSFWTT